MKKQLLKLLIIPALLAPSASYLASSQPVESAVAANFQAGRIIDDLVFTDANSMTPDDVQVFLNSKVPVCETNHAPDAQYSQGAVPPWVCLKDYYENPTTGENNLNGQPVPGGLSAAQIIVSVAKQFNISPKVLLVLLQKENGLITDTWPYPWQYRTAAGFACPDSAACNPAYYGFYKQVYQAGRHFRGFYDQTPGWTVPFRPGVNYISYQANNPGCGQKQVYIENRSTAALYSYTPYTPNDAALNNLYGTGDACSAYGNRNFWRYFTDWFGPTLVNDTALTHPDGTLIKAFTHVYVVSNGTRRIVLNGAVFDSYKWKWSSIKPATTGDYNLSDGAPVNTFRPGTLFRAPGSSVYVMAWDSASSSWKKQLVTYQAFVSLGYKWEEVQVIDSAQMPAPTMASALLGSTHPDGTLISTSNDGRVWMLEGGTRRYVRSAETLYSYNATWSNIIPATEGDKALPVGADLPYQEGTLLTEGSNIWVVDIPASGPHIKRPVGPWSCFNDILRFRYDEVFKVPAGQLPNDTGSLVTC